MTKTNEFNIKKTNITKALRIMKLMTFFLIVGLSVCSAVNSYSQTTRLSLKLNNKTIKEAFSQIEKQSEYIFFYYDNVLDVKKKVSVDVENQTVDKILDELLKTTGNTYTISDRQIYISKPANNTTEAILEGNQQPNRGIVSGTVIDAKNGEPMAGATIKYKGADNVSTMADGDGKFALQVPDTKNGVLEVSLIGFKTREVEIKDQKVILIPMEEDVTALDEVVVVGFSTQKKGSVIGSVDRIQPQQLKQPTRTLSTSLAGRLAGVIAVQSSGEPGYDGATFWIRGVNTFQSEKQTPLILVDGIERSLDDVDSEEIADFTILKDATATAVYGVRGGNGVVLITTKKGVAGKPRISFKAEMGFSAPVDIPNYADGPTYMRMMNEALINSGQPALYTQEKIENTVNRVDPYLYPNVNWMDELIQNWRPTERINVNISGGSETVRYFVSGSVFNQNGMFKKFDEGVSFNNNISTTRYNFRSNVDVNVTKTTVLGLSIGAILEDRNFPGEGTGDIFSWMRQIPPTDYPMTFPDKTKTPGFAYGTGRNPYQMLARSGYTTQNISTVQSTFNLLQDLSFITPGLQAKGIFSFDTYSFGVIKRKMRPRPYMITGKDDEGNYIYQDMEPNNSDYYTYLVREVPGIGGENDDNLKMRRKIYLEASLIYNRDFGPHSVGALFLYNQSDEQYPTHPNLYQSVPRRNQGITGRVSYAFQNKYFTEFNFGYNGSENFKKGERYGFFPAIAVGWVPSSESFMDFMKPAIDYMKIRVSHGTVGNDNLNDRFAYLTRVEQIDGSNVGFGTNNGYGYGAGKGINFTYYGNPAATWEKATKTDIGIEVRFLKDFNLQFDLFHEKRTNIWTELQYTPELFGFSKLPYANIGEMKNKGFDGFLEYRKQFNKDFALTAKFTYSFSQNEILADGKEKKKYEYQSEVGRSYGSNLGYISNGYFVDEEDVANSPSQTAISGAAPKPGDVKYVDYNGDGVIDEFDRVFLGHPTIPEITYGLGLSAEYKGFDLSVLFQGADRVSFFANPKTFSEVRRGNVYDFMVDNYWSEANPDLQADFPRLGIGEQTNNYTNSDKWLQNGKYIRLKQAEFGYTLPTNMVRKFGIGSVRFYTNGVNLFTISPFKWWDAESKSSNGAYYPIQRVFNFGVEVKF